MTEELPVVNSLDELARLVRDNPDLYIRWSHGPAADEGQQCRDELSGAELPGLAANPLAVEDWWEDRPVRVWVARGVVESATEDWGRYAERSVVWRVANGLFRESERR